MSLIVRTLEDAADILAVYNLAALNATAVWTGCKFGRWLDLVLMQKRLASEVRP